MESVKKRKAGLVISQDVAVKLSQIPNIGPRQYYVHSLIKSYGLLDKLKCIPVTKASTEDLLAFHSRDYVGTLARASSGDQELEEAGLGYDCPVLEDTDMLDWALTVAGATLAAASRLVTGDLDTVLHWGGGWHHAHRDTAAGFCYINDIVLAIHKLQ